MAAPTFCPECVEKFADLLTIEEVDLYSSRKITYHKSFSHLELSAAAGCTLCQLIYQRMVMEVGKYEYQKKPGPLATCQDPILLEQQQFGTQFGIFLELGDFGLELCDIPMPAVLRSNSEVRYRSADPTPLDVENCFKIDHDKTEVFTIVKDWLDACCNSHSLCTLGGSCIKSHEESQSPEHMESIFLPSRLLALGGSIDDPSVKLVLSSKLSSSRTDCRSLRYATLSYCWGPAQSWGAVSVNDSNTAAAAAPPSRVTTTPSNYKSHLEAVDFHSLPPIFRHAVQVCLKLGLSYLWIDALCIIQPTASDTTDWDRESSKMGTVYMCSSLNICATGSDSVFGGLFSPRKAQRFPSKPVRIDGLSKVYANRYPIWINPSPADAWNLIEDSPIATRGWVLQERFLAPRTLHFTKQAIFWVCRELNASEHDVAGQPPSHIHSGAIGSDLLSWRYLLYQGADTEGWYRIAQRYSRLQLTEPKDKLPAIGGLAKFWSITAQFGEASYLAGLWQQDLLKGMSWKTEIINIDWKKAENQYGRIEGIPSWSWASLQPGCGVDFDFDAEKEFNWHVKVLDMAVKPRDEQNPYGQVLGGSMKIKGKLKRFKFQRRDLQQTYEYTMNTVESYPGGIGADEHYARLYLDEPGWLLDMLKREQETFEVMSLRLNVCRKRHPVDDVEIRGSHEQNYIAVAEVLESTGPQYRRIGMVQRRVYCHSQKDSDLCVALDDDGKITEIELL